MRNIIVPFPAIHPALTQNWHGRLWNNSQELISNCQRAGSLQQLIFLHDLFAMNHDLSSFITVSYISPLCTSDNHLSSQEQWTLSSQDHATEPRGQGTFKEPKPHVLCPKLGHVFFDSLWFILLKYLIDIQEIKPSSYNRPKPGLQEQIPPDYSDSSPWIINQIHGFGPGPCANNVEGPLAVRFSFCQNL